MSQPEAKELTQARKLIDEGKLDKVLSILTNFEEQGGHTLYNVVLCKFLKCQVFRYQGLFEKVITLGEQTYNKSLELGENLLSIDILLLMAEVLSVDHKFDKAYNKISMAEDHLNRLTEESTIDYKQREAHIAAQKGTFYSKKNEFDKALEYIEHSLALHKELGIKHEIVSSLIEMGWYLGVFKGELNIALKYAEQALVLAEESNVRWSIMLSLHFLGSIFYLKGELDRSIKLFEQALAIGRENNNRFWMAVINNGLSEAYRGKGQLDLSLECIEQAYEFFTDVGNKMGIAAVSDFLIQILIDKGDLKRAQRVFDQFKQLNIEWNDKQYSLWYRFYNVLVLKTSPLARNRGKAEEMLKEILKEEDLSIDMKIRGLINLSELLLTELQLTNEAEVLEEIKLFITELLDLSGKSNSFWVLGETYLVQAKLALISLNPKEAQKFLIQGQKIAEKYGLNRLAIKISNEHDELLKKLDVWDKLKESKAPLSERMELAGTNEQMERMIQKREIVVPELTDEDPIVLLIISEGGRPLFSESFAEEWSFEDHLFGGFLTAINSFSVQMFSEGLNRANFGEYTIIMNSLPPFQVCYLFKGQSYLALQRLRKFTDSIKEDTNMWKTFNEFNQACRLIQVKDIPSLEPLITKIFIDKTVSLIS